MTATTLERAASEFAADLSALIQQSVDPETAFEVIEVDDTDVRIGPGPLDAVGRGGFQFIPLRRTCDDPEQPPRLVLKIEFRVALDDEAAHLTVVNSTFGLWVRPRPDRSPRPVFRVEYDRDARSKPAAHVHIHAESVELGWIYGTAGRSLPSLQEVHFPVGGRRFRPTVEEVLLFLDREELFDGWVSDDWRSAVAASREEFDARQAQATVRRHQEAAIVELERLGYTVAASANPT